MLGTLVKIFTQLRYVQVAVLVTVIVLSAAILYPNISIIWQVSTAADVSLLSKLHFIWSLYGLLFSNFTLIAAFNTVIISVLLGINIALLVYYIRRRQAGSRNTSGNAFGLTGAVAGVFGLGCAACGSVILTAFLTWFGLGGLLLLLPFHGAEFGILAIVLLGASISRLLKKIQDPLVCEVK